jgi:hypothetical protein
LKNLGDVLALRAMWRKKIIDALDAHVNFNAFDGRSQLGPGKCFVLFADPDAVLLFQSHQTNLWQKWGTDAAP